MNFLGSNHICVVHIIAACFLIVRCNQRKITIYCSTINHLNSEHLNTHTEEGYSTVSPVGVSQISPPTVIMAVEEMLRIVLQFMNELRGRVDHCVTLSHDVTAGQSYSPTVLLSYSGCASL